jgi:hypothetical protein
METAAPHPSSTPLATAGIIANSTSMVNSIREPAKLRLPILMVTRSIDSPTNKDCYQPEIPRPEPAPQYN